VNLNGTDPDGGDYIPRPWKTRVTSVEGGIDWPYASAAMTATYSAQQIADFLNKYILPTSAGPERKSELVRDSAATAGIPSRNNVFEYGFRETGSLPPPANTGATNPDKSGPGVFVTGASPAPFLPPVCKTHLGGCPD
jgi:hypothetical protein